MRIDVHPDPAGLEAELDILHAKLRAGGEDFAPTVARLPLPGLTMRRREADGESYVYVEDTLHERLAGCIVFNRLIEVSRKTDPLVRSPHSRFRPVYQRRGLARYIYARELEAGWCLISGARQSPGAHALWRSLSRQYALRHIRVGNKTRMRVVSNLSPAERDHLGIRMLLLGRGCTLEALAGLAGGTM